MRTPLVASRATPLLLAHGGATSRAPDHSLEAMRSASLCGTDGLELDVGRTRDGHLVVARDGRLRRGLRTRAVADLARGDLPETIPSLSAALATLAPSHHLALHLPDADCLEACLAALDAVPGLRGRVWLCHDDLDTCAGWADAVSRRDGGASPAPFVVFVARLEALPDGPERCVARLADAGVAAVALPHDQWSGGLVALAHRFGLEAFARGVEFARQAHGAMAAGCDLVSGGRPEALVEARDRRSRATAPTSGEPAR